MKKFMIRFKDNLHFIAGFNTTHQVVTMCTDTSYAKRFNSAAAAATWITKFSSCGYGLESDQVEVVAV